MTYCSFLMISSSIFSGWCFMLTWLLEWVLASLFVVLCMWVASFFFFFIYFNSYNRGGGIWTLDVSVGNTKRCQMSYKALGSSMYIYDDLIDNMQSVWQWTNCNAICGLRGLDSNLVLWHLNILANWAFSGKLYALPTTELRLQKLITVTHLKLLNH